MVFSVVIVSASGAGGRLVTLFTMTGECRCIPRSRWSGLSSMSQDIERCPGMRSEDAL